MMMVHLDPCMAVTAPILTKIHRQTFEVPWSEQAFRACLRLPTVFGRLAVTDEKASQHPLGFILWQRVPEECEILTICVLPNERRMGVGRRLVGACGEANENIDIVLEVAQNNTAALSLYQRFGFEAVGLRRDYYRRANGKKMDAVILRRAAYSETSG